MSTKVVRKSDIDFNFLNIKVLGKEDIKVQKGIAQFLDSRNKAFYRINEGAKKAAMGALLTGKETNQIVNAQKAKVGFEQLFNPIYNNKVVHNPEVKAQAPKKRFG